MALDTTDPLALALLRNSAGSGMGSGPILMQQPEQKMRMMMAQQLMGADPAGARTKGEGLARVGQQLLGAYLAKQGMDEAKVQRDSDAGLMSAALRSQDKTPTTYTDDAGNSQTIKWNAPDPSAMTSIMAQGSPGLQQQALAMALSDRQRQADIAAKTVKTLSPAEAKAAGFQPGAVVQQDSYGGYKIVTEGSPWQPLGSVEAPSAPAPAGGGTMTAPPATGTQTVPKPAGGMTAAPLRPAIARAALENNVDPVMALTAAHIESGMGTAPDRKGSQYQGVFQMGDDRWKEAGGTPDMRGDQRAQVNVGVKSLGLTRDQLAQKLGRAPEPWEVYLAHQQGVTGAAALLGANPDASAVQTLAPFYKAGGSLQAIVNNTPGDPDANITAGGFTGLWRDRFNSIAKNYGNFTTPQAVQGGAPAAAAQQDMTAGLADPMRGMPPGSAVVPDAQPPTAQPVQVAQASTGTMTDAAPAAVPTPAPDRPGEWTRYANQKTGQLSDFEVNRRTGEKRPYMKPNFSTVDMGTSTGVIDGNTGEVVRAIPKDVAGEAAAKKQGETQAQKTADAPKAVQQADLMLSAIDGTLNHPGFSWGTGKSSWTTHLPGTQAYDFGKRVEQLQGQAFLQAFESMKGGGAISEMEGKKAQSAIARLDNAQTEEGFRQALGELRGIVTAARERAIAQGGGAVPGAAQQPGAAPPPAASSAPALPPGFQMVE